MIKIETLHIEEFRGIRKLDIDFSMRTFAISGPNGTGKSGVIDAIEFGLTGKISRLAGIGTKGLSVSEHGPHVDKIKSPEVSFVELKVFFPALGKSAKIKRSISAPARMDINPPDAEIKSALLSVADHPEITLARRDILRFILVEPSKRSEEVQAILKLDKIGQTRAALNSAQNKLLLESKSTSSQVQISRDALQRHLQISTFGSSELLAAVNPRREALGLLKIESLTSATRLDEGLAGTDKLPEFSKKIALNDLGVLLNHLDLLVNIGREDVDAILTLIGILEGDPALLLALQRRSLVEKGLDLVNSPECPLCDSLWPDVQQLLAHLKVKLSKSEDAGKIQTALESSGVKLTAHTEHLLGLLRPVLKIARGEGDAALADTISEWGMELQELKRQFSNLDGLIGLKERLSSGWAKIPAALYSGLVNLTACIEAKPDDSVAIEAQTFLITAQLRLEEYRRDQQKNDLAKKAGTIAKITHDTYCKVMEEFLTSLYEDVQADFSKFYRQINEDDEATFNAKLTPSEGRLDLSVDFFERGLYPPGAYHSEGHQDGMGVCLYLALVKRLLGENFTIALLDDVVMSVDSGHRYQFCKLLKTHFPGTQFIITTHDRLWAEQMKSAGLVNSKASLVFRSWTVDTGPIVESNIDIWDEIAISLSKGKVEAAAHSLRHHLEYSSRYLADQVGARLVFRADGNYDLGELLPNTLARVKDLYGKAIEAAQSWGHKEIQASVIERKEKLSSSVTAIGVEQWAVNKAVHYNEWASFVKQDFEPVVASFKETLDSLRCYDCQSWLYVTPRGQAPETLRCQCSKISLNLKRKAT